jgi:hypothetical protein
MAVEESAAPQEKTGGSEGTRGAVSFGSAGAGEIAVSSLNEFIWEYQKSCVCGVSIDERQYRAGEERRGSGNRGRAAGMGGR